MTDSKFLSVGILLFTSLVLNLVGVLTPDYIIEGYVNRNGTLIEWPTGLALVKFEYSRLTGRALFPEWASTICIGQWCHLYIFRSYGAYIYSLHFCLLQSKNLRLLYGSL